MHHLTRSSGSGGFNLLLIVYFGAALIALGVMRLRGRPWGEVWSALGWRGCAPVWFAWALLVAAVTAIAGGLAVALLDPGYLQHPTPGTDQYQYARIGLALGAVVRALLVEAFNEALGEEVFFRGLLGGWLTSRLGFQAGNAAQAVLFMIPHLTLLLVSVRLWPLLIVQLAGGWLLGWLRVRSGSILPGWLAHTLINTASDVMFMIG
jgi:uncharacterized protein